MTSIFGLRRLLLCAVAFVSAAGPALAEGVGSLRFIGSVTVPNELRVDDTVVGGLSGIDYDSRTGLWYLISDDRSDKSPARFYVARLIFGLQAFTSVDIVKSVTLHQPDGTPYPRDAVDPESIRVDSASGRLWWTTEGGRGRDLDPGVRISTVEGRAVSAVPTPPMFRVDSENKRGSRSNYTFEALSFAPDGRSVFVAMESAIYEDGAMATPDHGAMTRITRLDRKGKVLAQYAYRIDAIPAKPAPGKSADNGVAEILALDNRRLLVLERSAVEGEDGWKNYIRIYEIDIAGATDIRAMPALTGAAYTPLSKRLVLDLSKDGTIAHTDNIEGMSFGPRLSNGRRSLVLVSDNNFQRTQITQFLAFEIRPQAHRRGAVPSSRNHGTKKRAGKGVAGAPLHETRRIKA